MRVMVVGGGVAGAASAVALRRIGTDGIWSATRSILDPAAPAPGYAGLYSVSGQADHTGIPARPGVFNMVFARNGAFLYVPAPDHSLWWSAQVASPQQPPLGEVTDRQWLERLAELFRFEQVPQAIVRATIRLHRPTLLHVLAPVGTWRNDRIVLVGDAAHPVGAGQGAAMAIEDAVVLARQLATAGSPAAALAAYEQATAWLYTHDLGTLPTTPSRAGRSGG